MIQYTDSLEGIEPEQLTGFFEGWPDQPSSQTHFRVLEGSDHTILALDIDTGRVIGFVTAISDGALSAYIPLLEVLPSYRGRGIGTELARRMIEKLQGLYMIDVVCDEAVRPFYERMGFTPRTGMVIRNRQRQSGADG